MPDELVLSLEAGCHDQPGLILSEGERGGGGEREREFLV
jgi:hypothetical protein